MWLRQSTTITLQVGPFLDNTDGVTPETGLTPAVEISKGGAVFAARNSATAVVHDAEGFYRIELDATDTNTLGRLKLKAIDSTNHVPVFHDFMVLTANAWDSMFGADTLQVHVIEFTADVIDATAIAANAIGSSELATDAIGSAQVATSAVNEIRDSILSDSTAFAGADVATILVDTADMQPKLGSPAVDISADIAAVKAETALIVADTNELQTDDVPGLIAALNDLSTSQVNTEVDTALSDVNLNHLMKDAAVTGDVTDDSIIARLTSKSATAAFVDYLNTTDSLQAQRDNTGSAVGADISADIAAVKVDTTATLVDTADIQPKIGTPAADLSADIAAVKVDTAAVLVDTGTTLDTKINDIQGTTFSSATDSLEAIRDRGDAAWTTGSVANPTTLQNTIIATLASQTSFTLTAGSADNDAYNGCLAVVEDSATATQKAVGVISDYVGSTKTIILLNDPGIFTMAVGDTIDIIADRAVKPIVDNRTLAVSASGEVNLLAATQTSIDAIEIDTSDMQPKLGSPAADISADIAAVKVDTAATLVDTAQIGVAGAGLTDLGGMSTGMKAEVNAECDTAISDAALATAVNLATVDTVVDTILVDTADMQPKLGSPAADISADIAAVKVDTAAVLVDTADIQPKIGTPAADISADIAAVKVDTAATLIDTTEIGVAGVGLTDLGGMSTGMKAEVNAEMVDVESVDLITQPGQEAPVANQTRDKMLAFLYKAWRNKKTQSASEYGLFNKDTTTVDQKATLSEVASVVTAGEVATGP